ncbi:MAG: glycosyltransferase family 4 protein [Epsilonproteobacteria bacterium]|nr:glycosyltransferase family 4 protein [Campylobacterota bacterium]
MSKRLLLIGPRLTKNDPTITGGTMILFERLLRDLDKLGVEYKTIDTNALNYKNFAHAWFSAVFQFLKNIKNYDHTSIHGTINHYLFVAPIVIFVSKILKKSVSLRKFAGNFDKVYEKGNFLVKKDIEYILKNSNVNFFETKYLVEYFKKFNKNTYWFPNVRERKIEPDLNRNFRKRFVFMSQVREEKGMKELLEASNMMDDDYTLDVYGFFYKNEFNEDFFKGYKANYKGALLADEVLDVLKTYDVLVLPSYREGYPGIVIEAFSLGIPVIVTKLPSLKEIVEDKVNGILIDVGSSEQIWEAMKSFNEENYGRFVKEAYKAFEPFDSMKRTKKFLELIDGY